VLEDAVSALEHAGATVDAVDPDLGRQRGDPEAYYTMATVRWGSLLENLEDEGFDPLGEDRDRLRPYLVDPIMDAEEPTTREYKRADVVRTHVLDGLVDLFEEYDLLVTATGTTPFPRRGNRRRSTASRSSRIGAGCSRSRSTSPATCGLGPGRRRRRFRRDADRGPTLLTTT